MRIASFALTSSLALVGLVGLLASCGGGDSLPECTGSCGTLTVKVGLTDTDAAPVSCTSAGVARIALSLEFEGAATITRTIDCDPGSIELGPLAIGIYKVTARALDGAGLALGENTRSAQLVKKGDVKEAQVLIVPGPPSTLGAVCGAGNACGAGYACVSVDFSGTKTSFCTTYCGSSPMDQPPMNGDLTCQRGYSGPGIPTCLLYSSLAGAVDWSCLIGCGPGMTCPTGMTCLAQSGGTAVCINP